MYFFKKRGKQYLDLTGNLILSHNDNIVKARSKSAGPSSIFNDKYIILGDHRIKATIATLRFIWGKPNPLLIDDTNYRAPVRVHKPKLLVKKGTPSTIEQPGQDNLYDDFESDERS